MSEPTLSRTEWAGLRRLEKLAEGLTLRDAFFVLRRAYRDNQNELRESHRRLFACQRALRKYAELPAVNRLRLAGSRRRLEQSVAELRELVWLRDEQRERLLPALFAAAVEFERGYPTWHETAEWLGISWRALEGFLAEHPELRTGQPSLLLAAFNSAEVFGGRSWEYVALRDVAISKFAEMLQTDSALAYRVRKTFSAWTCGAIPPPEPAREFDVIDGGRE